METPAPHGPSPVVLAMVLCDVAITEHGTNKKTLVGIFQRVLASVFPTLQRMFLYVQMTDAQGVYIFRIDFVDVDRDHVRGTATVNPIEVPNRLDPFDFVFPLTIEISGPGLYEFRLYANDVFLNSISFTAQGPHP